MTEAQELARRALQESMDLRDQGHTVILITHDAHVAAHADRTYEMHDGELHAQSAAVSG